MGVGGSKLGLAAAAFVVAGGALGLALATMRPGAATAGQLEMTRAQIDATVSVNSGNAIGVIPKTAFGLNTAVWDANLLDKAVPQLLRAIHVGVLRYPGGSTSDKYQWSTNTMTPGQSGKTAPQDNFANFMTMARVVGAQPLITVNYGSNPQGTGGGTPQNAAAWVKYADVTHQDGANYWEIGNEVYGDGFYGQNYNWEVDLHANKGPQAYADNALSFIKAMRAVDPNIKIGVFLVPPGSGLDHLSPNWNRTVLAIVGKYINFVSIHWYAQRPSHVSDAGLFQTTAKIPAMMDGVKALLHQYCDGHPVQVMITETNSATHPGKQSVSLVNALFLANDYMTWLENGAANVDWWDLHNGILIHGNNSPSLYGAAKYGDFGILSSGTKKGGMGEPAVNTPFPTYYGYEMMAHLASPGDLMLSANSSQKLVAVHAVRQTNGDLRVLLTNESPSATYRVSVNLSNYQPASRAVIYYYGEHSTDVTRQIISGISENFTQTLAPYSLTTLVMSPGK